MAETALPLSDSQLEILRDRKGKKVFRLEDMNVVKVDLVKTPANLKSFLIVKSQEDIGIGVVNMTNDLVELVETEDGTLTKNAEKSTTEKSDGTESQSGEDTTKTSTEDSTETSTEDSTEVSDKRPCECAAPARSKRSPAPERRRESPDRDGRRSLRRRSP